MRTVGSGSAAKTVTLVDLTPPAMVTPSAGLELRSCTTFTVTVERLILGSEKECCYSQCRISVIELTWGHILGIRRISEFVRRRGSGWTNGNGAHTRVKDGSLTQQGSNSQKLWPQKSVRPRGLPVARAHVGVGSEVFVHAVHCQSTGPASGCPQSSSRR